MRIDVSTVFNILLSNYQGCVVTYMKQSFLEVISQTMVSRNKSKFPQRCSAWYLIFLLVLLLALETSMYEVTF